MVSTLDLSKGHQMLLPSLTKLCEAAVQEQSPRHVTANMLKAISFANAGASNWFQCAGCSVSHGEVLRLFALTNVPVALIQNMLTFHVNGIPRMVHFELCFDNIAGMEMFDDLNKAHGVQALACIRFGKFAISGRRFFRHIEQRVRIAKWREFVACEAWQARWACDRLDLLLDECGKKDPLTAFSCWEDTQDQRVNSYGYRIESVYKKLVALTGER